MGFRYVHSGNTRGVDWVQTYSDVPPGETYKGFFSIYTRTDPIYLYIPYNKDGGFQGGGRVFAVIHN